MKSTVVTVIFVSWCLALGWSVSSAAVAQAESEPVYTLKSADVLPADMLKGNNYTVDGAVHNDGLISTYTLSTDYGPTTVEGTLQLTDRIAELHALQIMDEVDRKKVFGDAVVRGVKAPVQVVAELVQDPGGTSKSIVEGAGRFFSNIGNAIVSEDPHQDNALKVAVGYDVAKRQFAFEFGINPYTTYEPAVQRLGEIARAAVAGGMTPKAVLAMADSPVATGLRISGVAKGLKELVRDNSPAELHKINKAKMQEMGVPDSLIEEFLSNYSYDPQEETLLVGALATMKGVQDREKFFAIAKRAADPELAVYFRIVAQMMAGYHGQVALVERLLDLDGTPHLLTQKGDVVLVTPVDYLFWTPKVAAKVGRLDQKVAGLQVSGKKEVWITGQMDTGARNMLRTAGWQVHEKCAETLLR